MFLEYRIGPLHVALKNIKGLLNKLNDRLLGGSIAVILTEKWVRVILERSKEITVCYDWSRACGRSDRL